MTTGRINQVTNVTGEPPASERPPETPPRWEGQDSLRGWGGPRGPRRARADSIPFEERSERSGRAHPIAPTEFPKERSAAGAGAGAVAGPHTAACVPQEEDTLNPSRPRGDGYGHRLTPKCLTDGDGHRPIIHGLHQRHGAAPRSSGRPPPGSRRAGALSGGATYGAVRAERHATQTTHPAARAGSINAAPG